MLSSHNIEDIYPLSPMQEGMYFHALYHPASTAYFEQYSYRVQGSLDVNVFARSLQALFDRHGLLRTVFNHQKANLPLQVVLRQRQPELHYQELAGTVSPAEQEAWVSAYKLKDRARGFNLASDVLMRVGVLKLAESRYEIVWSHHHILVDGWSMPILRKEFNGLYQCFLEGSTPHLRPVKPYRQYIDWLGRQDPRAAWNYWTDYLRGYEEAAVFPASPSPAGSLEQYDNQSVRFRLDEARTRSLRAMAGAAGTTINTMLLTAWAVLLGKYNGRCDVVFGQVVSGRPAEIDGIEELVGLFINTTPVRVRWQPDEPFSELVRSVHASEVESKPYQYLSLAKVQSLSAPRQALVNHILVFDNYPTAPHLDVSGGNGPAAGGETAAAVGSERFEQTNYDLNVLVSVGTGIAVELNFNARTYSRTFIERLGEHLLGLLGQIAADPAVPLARLTAYLPPRETALLRTFNQTAAPYPADRTLHSLFEQCAAANPERIALAGGKRELTYRALNERANVLAHCLRTHHGAGPDELIGLCMDRSEWMIISILAVLKAGAAYVPLDPAQPAARLACLLEDARPRVLLVDEQTLASHPWLEGEVPLLLESAVDQSGAPVHNPPVAGSPAQLAYVIYTSGSTGTPKGVMVEHGGVVNRIDWMWKRYDFTASDVILQKTPYVFDVSVWEIFMTLCYGARLVLCPREAVYDPLMLAGLIGKNRVTTLHFVPGAYHAFLKGITGQQRALLGSLRQVMASGEALPAETVKLHYQTLPVPLHNLYGPTEASVDVSDYTTRPGDTSIPIGKPISNIALYVLNGQRGMVPVGAAGEIAIAGVGVARGYHRRPGLTAQKFVDNPCRPGEKLYLTGDQGRWNEAGDLEFIGRRDGQVKLRGFRIELGEIENQLLRHAGVRSAAVVLQENGQGDKHLVGYYVSPGALTPDHLRACLQEVLPAWMVPAYLVPLESLPLTASGKVDRNALPPAGAWPEPAAAEAPENELETRIAGIWQQVLGVGKVGRTDNFFAVGGHSLNAIRLASKINHELRTRVSIADIFKYPDVKSLAGRILADRQKGPEADRPAVLQQYYEASHQQKKEWLLFKLRKDRNPFNIHKVYQLGSLDYDLVERTYKYLAGRHESMRTVFQCVDGEIRQKIIANEAFRFRIEVISLREEDNAFNKAGALSEMEHRTPFDLEQGPLFRIKLLQLPGDQYQLLFTIHHVVADDASLQVLEEEATACYRAFAEGRQADLPPVKMQYKDYVAELNESLRGEEGQQHRAYWASRLAGPLPVLQMKGRPAGDRQRGLAERVYAGMCRQADALSLKDSPAAFELLPRLTDCPGASCKLMVEEGLLSRLDALAARTGASLFTVLVAGFNLALRQATGETDLIIDIPITTRDREDRLGVVGWLAGGVPCRTVVDEALPVEAFIRSVSDNLAGGYRYKAYPIGQILTDVAAPFDYQVQTHLNYKDLREDENALLEYFEPRHGTEPVSYFDLSARFLRYHNGLTINCVYRLAFAAPDQVAELLGQYLRLLDAMTRAAGRTLGSLLSAAVPQPEPLLEV